MMEHAEREALSGVSLEVRLEEVVSLLEEIPSMVKLNPLQLGESRLLILGVETIIGSGRREDCRHGHKTSGELVVWPVGKIA